MFNTCCAWNRSRPPSMLAIADCWRTIACSASSISRDNRFASSCRSLFPSDVCAGYLTSCSGIAPANGSRSMYLRIGRYYVVIKQLSLAETIKRWSMRTGPEVGPDLGPKQVRPGPRRRAAECRRKCLFGRRLGSPRSLRLRPQPPWLDTFVWLSFGCRVLLRVALACPAMCASLHPTVPPNVSSQGARPLREPHEFDLDNSQLPNSIECRRSNSRSTRLRPRRDKRRPLLQCRIVRLLSRKSVDSTQNCRINDASTLTGCLQETPSSDTLAREELTLGCKLIPTSGSFSPSEAAFQLHTRCSFCASPNDPRSISCL